MKIIHSFDTWQGGREQQQDDWGFNEFLDNDAVLNTEGALAVVADGMGGLALGQEASRLAKALFLDSYHEQMARGGNQHVSDVLRKCIKLANEGVLNLSRSHELEGDVGTTLVAAVVKGDYLYWISVGDSRIYLVRNNELVQLTVDHNYETELLLSNMDYAQARNHPEAHALTSYLGIPGLKEIDQNIRPLRLQPDDLIILASDGLFNVLPDSEILKVVNRSHPNKIANFLIAEVKPRSSPEQDNTTVLTFKVGVPDRHNANGSAMPPARPTVERQGRAYDAMADEGSNDAFYAAPSSQKKKTSIPLLVAVSVFLVALAAVLWTLIPQDEGASVCQAQDDTFEVKEKEQKALDILANDGCAVDNFVRVDIENTSVLGLASWDDQTKMLRFKANNKAGQEDLRYRLVFTENGKERSRNAIATITILGVNDPPVAVSDREQIRGNRSFVFRPLENDTDPDEGDKEKLSIVSIGTPQQGRVEMINEDRNEYRYTLNAGATGQDRFSYTISDGQLEAEGEIVIDIDFVNNRPEAEPDVILISASDAFEGNEVELNILDNDRDRDPGDKANLQIVSFSDPSEGKLETGDGGELYYIVGSGNYTTDSFTYNISDGAATSRTEAEVTIEIERISPGALVATLDREEVEQDSGPHVFDVLENDLASDGDKSTLIILDVEQIEPEGEDAGEVRIIDSDTKIEFTPAEGFSGPVLFTYVVTDKKGGQERAELRITVTSTSTGDTSEGEDGSDTSEIEGDLQDGEGNVQEEGDGSGGSVIEISEVNGEFSLESQGSFDITYPVLFGNITNMSEVNRDSLRIDVDEESTDKGGKVVVGENVITYTPKDGFTGEDSFTVNISDGNRSGKALVIIDVQP